MALSWTSLVTEVTSFRFSHSGLTSNTANAKNHNYAFLIFGIHLSLKRHGKVSHEYWFYDFPFFHKKLDRMLNRWMWLLFHMLALQSQEPFRRHPFVASTQKGGRGLEISQILLSLNNRSSACFFRMGEWGTLPFLWVLNTLQHLLLRSSNLFPNNSLWWKQIFLRLLSGPMQFCQKYVVLIVSHSLKFSKPIFLV